MQNPELRILPQLFTAAFHELSLDEQGQLEQQLRVGAYTLRAAVNQGYASVDSVDEWVDFWHDTIIPVQLRDFLGLSTEEYSEWMKSPLALADMFTGAIAPAENRVFTSTEYIPMAFWGKDHWSTLAYAETVMVECHGFQVGMDPRMKTSRRNWRVMNEGCPNPKRPSKCTGSAMVMNLAHSTKLNDAQVVVGHDDWACIQDMAAEGLLTQRPEEIEPGVVVKFSAKGTEVAAALRLFKCNNGQFAQFRWPAASVLAPSPTEESVQ